MMPRRVTMRRRRCEVIDAARRFVDYYGSAFADVDPHDDRGLSLFDEMSDAVKALDTAESM